MALANIDDVTEISKVIIAFQTYIQTMHTEIILQD